MRVQDAVSRNACRVTWISNPAARKAGSAPVAKASGYACRPLGSQTIAISEFQFIRRSRASTHRLERCRLEGNDPAVVTSGSAPRSAGSAFVRRENDQRACRHAPDPMLTDRGGLRRFQSNSRGVIFLCATGGQTYPGRRLRAHPADERPNLTSFWRLRYGCLSGRRAASLACAAELCESAFSLRYRGVWVVVSSGASSVGSARNHQQNAPRLGDRTRRTVDLGWSEEVLFRYA